MSSNTGIQTNSENNGLGIQAFYLGIGIQFIEVADSKGQIGIGKELYSFSLFQTHKQRVDILFDGPFLQQCSKRMGGFLKRRNICDGSNGVILLLEPLIVDDFGNTHNNTTRVEVIVESFAFTQEFGREQQIEPFYPLLHVLDIQTPAVTYGNRRLDNHDGLRIDLQDQIDHLFDMACVKIVLDGVVVCRSGNHDKIRIPIGGGAIQCGGEIQRLLGQISFNIVILNRRLFPIQHLHLLGNNINCGYLMMLCQQCGDRQANIAGSGYGDL